MSALAVAVWVVVAVVVLALISLAVMYNRFVRQRTLCAESWGDIDVELTRRHDLIPNLVSTVKAYAEHERALLQTLVASREAAVAGQSESPRPRGQVEARVDDALQQVLARVEAYPELKANAGFLSLQHELATTEDRIAASRRFYNGNVRAYNTRLDTFPSNLVGSTFHFARREFFQAEGSAVRQAPVVDLEQPT